MKKNKFNFGFTLLEILVSIGILAIISILLSQTFISVTRTNSKGEISREIKQNGDSAIGIMTRLIQNSLTVSSACDAAGTSANTLTIVNPDGGSSIFSCDAAGSGVTRLASASGETPTTLQYLTSPDVTLGDDCATALNFTCTTLPDETKSVKISFNLSQLGSIQGTYEKATAAFTTTVNLRNR